jgi:hypothetical protein
MTELRSGQRISRVTLRRHQHEGRLIDAVSDEIPEVDRADANVLSVDEFEHREERGGTRDSLPNERAARADPIGYENRAALRRSRGHSTEVSAS